MSLAINKLLSFSTSIDTGDGAVGDVAGAVAGGGTTAISSFLQLEMKKAEDIVKQKKTFLADSMIVFLISLLTAKSLRKIVKKFYLTDRIEPNGEKGFVVFLLQGFVANCNRLSKRH